MKYSKREIRKAIYHATAPTLKDLYVIEGQDENARHYRLLCEQTNYNMWLKKARIFIIDNFVDEMGDASSDYAFVVFPNGNLGFFKIVQ